MTSGEAQLRGLALGLLKKRDSGGEPLDSGIEPQTTRIVSGVCEHCVNGVPAGKYISLEKCEADVSLLYEI